MEYRTLSMDYCIFTTGRDLQQNKTEYTVQVSATMFTPGFMFAIWINDEDRLKKNEIIKKHVIEKLALEHNTVRNLRKELEDTKENFDKVKNGLLEEIENAADDYYELKERFLEQQNNADYYRQKYLEKVDECEDLKADVQVKQNNTEYFKKKLEESNQCIKDYAYREIKSNVFAKEQNEEINALRNQIQNLKKENYLFYYVRHIKLKEIDKEIIYRMEYVQLKDDYLYHFIIEDDCVSYVPQIFFYQTRRDDESAIEYAQNLLNNETTLYRKLRTQNETITKQKEHISSLEKIVAEYRRKAQGNY